MHILELLDWKIWIILGVMTLAVIVGVITFSYQKNTPEKYFVYFVIFALLIEITGIYVGYGLNIINYFAGNAFMNGSVVFFIYYFHLKLESRLTIWIPIFVFIVGVILSFVFENYIIELTTYNVILGGGAILYCIFSYFSDLLNRREVENILLKPGIIISFGLLVFYLGVIPYAIFGGKLLKIGEFSLDVFLVFLNIVLYLSITLAFLANWKQTKS